jgi:hypothetical protein
VSTHVGDVLNLLSRWIAVLSLMKLWVDWLVRTPQQNFCAEEQVLSVSQRPRQDQSPQYCRHGLLSRCTGLHLVKY